MIRLKFMEFITHTVEGMPIKRQEIVSRKVTTQEELHKTIRKSPAMARSVFKVLLDALEPEMVERILSDHSKNGGAKKAAHPPVN